MNTLQDFVKPEVSITVFGIYEGMLVADFGAGTGAYSIPLAEKVGETGRVYAIEVQKELLANIKENARKRGLKNIEVIWGDIENLGGTKIKDKSIDAVVLSNTLFQAENKRGILREARRVLKTGGKFLLIDWTDSFNNFGPTPEMVITPNVARVLCESEGFVFKKEIPAGDHHYGFVFVSA